MLEFFKRRLGYRALARAVWPVGFAVAAIFVTGATLPLGHSASAQSGGNSAALTSLRAQIRRYGCHLPQYANSLAECRNLNARLQALRSGRYGAQPYGGYTRHSTAPSDRSGRQRRSSGGFFRSLFGGGSSQRRRANVNPYGVPYGAYGETYQGGLSGYSGSYGSAMHGSGGFRTLCVRTCDGFYWPMSFSTSHAGIDRDARQCRASCGAPARLFYHRNPGGDVQHSIDLNGQPYTRLENAFRYRKEYVADCRCKPVPWSEEAKAEFDRRGKDPDSDGEIELASGPAQLSIPMSGIQSAPASALEASVHEDTWTVQRRRRYAPRYRTSTPIFTDLWRDGAW